MRDCVNCRKVRTRGVLPLLFARKHGKQLVLGILLLLLVALSCAALLQPAAVPVLNYHQVNDQAHNMLTVSSADFDKQMACLADSGYNSITPDQLLDYLQNGKDLPANPVLITFDDGYEDNYRVAYPILKKYNFTATVFLITDFVGQNSRYLTWEQVGEMQNAGLVFESHTLSHILLPKCSTEEIRAQLVKSKEAMEWHLGRKAEYLAYPGGVYDQKVVNLTKEAGYRAAFTVDLGRDLKHCELFTLNRIPIFGGPHSFFHFWLRLKFTQAISALQNIKTYLGATFMAKFIYVP